MFFIYLRRELRRRRKAASVVALGLALGIALVITVTSVSDGMKQAQGSVLQSLYGLGTDMTVTKAPSPPSGSSGGRPSFNFDARGDGSSQSSDRVMVQGFQSLDSSVVSKVADQPHVAAAVGGLSIRVLKINGTFKQGQIHTRPGTSGGGRSGRGSRPGRSFIAGGGANFSVDNYTAYGVDTRHLGLGPLNSSKITSGKDFTAAQADAKVAVVDSAYAKQSKLTVGKTLSISGDSFKVIGIATADSGEAAANVYLPLQQAQRLADAKNKVTTVYVRADTSRRISAVKTEIQHDVSGTTVTTSADLASTVSGSLSTAANLASNVGKWLSIVVLIAAFLVAGLLTSSAVGRRVREFGTLKALGWKSGRVTRQVMGEALVNGLVGGVLGIALGLGAAYLITDIAPTLTARLGGTGGTGGFGGRFGGGSGGFGGFGSGGGRGGFGGAAHQAAGKALQVALTAPVSVSVVVLAVALAIGGGLVAGAFGGWRASRLRPADALRRVE